MHRLNRIALAVLATVALLAAGCTSLNKTLVPFNRQSDPIRSPILQEQLSGAVKRSVEQLDFRSLQGKAVIVEVNGVLPHSGEDLLDYVRTSVEARLSSQGARVVRAYNSCLLRDAARPDSGTATAGRPLAAIERPGAGAFSLATCYVEPNADTRVIVSVDSGGVAKGLRAQTNVPKLLGQLALPIVGLLGGAALSSASSDYGVSFMTLGSIGVLSGATWMVLSPPVDRSIKLTSNVGLTVHLLHRDANATTMTALGKSEIDIRPDDDQGLGWE